MRFAPMRSRLDFFILPQNSQNSQNSQTFRAFRVQKTIHDNLRLIHDNLCSSLPDVRVLSYFVVPKISDFPIFRFSDLYSFGARRDISAMRSPLFCARVRIVTDMCSKITKYLVKTPKHPVKTPCFPVATGRFGVENGESRRLYRPTMVYRYAQRRVGISVAKVVLKKGWNTVGWVELTGKHEIFGK